MKEYHKIQTVFNRDPNNRFKTLLLGEYALPEFEYLANNQWVFTEKVDGTNIRIMWDGENIVLGGKTDNASIPAFLITVLQDKFMTMPAKAIFKERFPNGCCLYGEGYGARIQKGGGNYKADGTDFCLFDIKVGNWWLKREAIEETALVFNVLDAPIIGQGTLPELVDKVRDGFESQWGIFKAEGIVARPEVELVSRSGRRIITKIKHKDFA